MINTPNLPLIAHSRLVHDLRQLGLTAGQAVMMHASVKAVGWIIGGPDVIIQSVLDVLGPAGTLLMYAAWESSPYDIFQQVEPPPQALLDEWPPFDPATARAMRAWSILTEYLRTWPGSQRSGNPEASLVAVGAKARWLTEAHPLQYGYGAGSPFDKLCQCGGQVLLIGAPLDAITLLHYSEHIARAPNKRVVRYKIPFMQAGRKTWVDVEEFDTADRAIEAEYTFEQIARDFMTAHPVKTGRVGAAHCYLFEAAPLAEFGARWFEQRFSYSEIREIART